MNNLFSNASKVLRAALMGAHARVMGVSAAMLFFGFAATPARASFWTTATIPGTPDASDDSSAVTLGLKFYSDVAGSVTGVRFYKGAYNTGTHIGALWTSTGTKLAAVSFSGETTSGWQQASFSTPVSITAGQTYVISYFAPRGNYADDQSYLWTSLNATPLHVSGSSPGVYAYGSSTTFPNGTWNNSNYFVDVVFVPATSNSTYTLSGKVSGTTGATVSLSGSASGSARIDASGNFSFPGLANGSYLVSASQSGYSFTPATTVVSVNNANVTGVNFTASQTIAHTVTLNWVASTSANVTGYKIYRAGVSNGPYALVGTSAISGTSYVDSNVVSGDTYYYVATAVNSSGQESGYSNQAVALVP